MLQKENQLKNNTMVVFKASKPEVFAGFKVVLTSEIDIPFVKTELKNSKNINIKKNYKI